ncbi:polysaccharide pyruvyl transferase family protein, partial [Staphylococcus carnosus]|uniref:polysaccharide pyruvyl transferase family protein n=3 Tax=Bacteria TaxID=2 RepID=UPI003F982F01
FPNKEIICLPQSIHFNNEDEKVRASKVFNGHPNFTFFVRDNESFEIAKSFSNQVVLMPDMAHSLHPLIDKREVVTNLNETIRILNQRRNDNEAKKRNEKIIKMSFDWDDMITYEDRMVKKIHNIKGKLKFEQNNMSNFWYKHSNIIAKRAIDYFLQHDLVYTDRLHGLILSALLGRNIIVYDNSYGKNSRYYKLWLKDIDNIKFNNE